MQCPHTHTLFGQCEISLKPTIILDALERLAFPTPYGGLV